MCNLKCQLHTGSVLIRDRYRDFSFRSNIWGGSGTPALLLIVHGALTAGIKRPEHDVDHLP